MQTPKFKKGATLTHKKTKDDYVVKLTPEDELTLEATNEPAYAYQAPTGGKLWVRKSSEMEDGRFELKENSEEEPEEAEGAEAPKVARSRRTTWNVCKMLISRLEKKRDSVAKEIEAAIRRKHTERRNKWPRWIRWIRPKEPTWDKIHYETTVNGFGMSMEGHLAVHYQGDIESLGKIVDLCERSDGEHVFLEEDQKLQIETLLEQTAEYEAA